MSHRLSKFSTNRNGALPGCIVHFDWLVVVVVVVGSFESPWSSGPEKLTV